MRESQESPQEMLGTITRPFLIASHAPATVRIASAETESGYLIINASDFDAATMTPYEAASAAPKTARKGGKGA
jgi:hypothetical protein